MSKPTDNAPLATAASDNISAEAPVQVPAQGRSFLQERIENDLADWRAKSPADSATRSIVTRFPPEPNGFLHIGHAKSIVTNFGLAREFGGHCHLRFDDTNPAKESTTFTLAITHDVRWLGYEWEHTHFTSDYFEKLYTLALGLIDKGLAYVDDESAQEMAAHRGTKSVPGTPSAGRSRSVDENRKLFVAMRAGEFDDGSRVLRAKIDLAAPNFVMRDPTLYRIRRQTHHRTEDAWCIYPMYDFAHCLSDAIEGITHSMCTLEFINNRPLYDWLIDNLMDEFATFGDDSVRPHQIEFNKLKLTYGILSKRKLRMLVEDGHVQGWDDPRLLTLSGLRKRGVPAAAIVDLCTRVGVSKNDAWTDFGLLESITRETIDDSPRRMAVLDPLKVVIETYGEDDRKDGESKKESFDLDNHPKIPEHGTRSVPFSREIYIEREDFAEDPPKKFFRLAPGREVRLRGAYLVTCTSVVKDSAGKVIEVRCSHDVDSRGGKAPDGRKVKGTLHWVSVPDAVTVQVRLYDRLFTTEQPGTASANAAAKAKATDAEANASAPHVDDTFLADLNPNSLTVINDAKIERSALDLAPGDRVQFERTGYFIVDVDDSAVGTPVFNRIVSLRDTWAKKAGANNDVMSAKSKAKVAQREAVRAAREERKRLQSEADKAKNATENEG